MIDFVCLMLIQTHLILIDTQMILIDTHKPPCETWKTFLKTTGHCTLN